MIKLDYMPLIGAPPFFFGMGPQEVDDAMGKMHISTKIGFIEGNFSYFYRDPFFKMTFSLNYGLHTIETVRDKEITVQLNDKLLLNENGFAEDILYYLTGLAGEPQFSYGVYNFTNIGLSIPMELNDTNFSLSMSNFLMKVP